MQNWRGAFLVACLVFSMGSVPAFAEGELRVASAPESVGGRALHRVDTKQPLLAAVEGPVRIKVTALPYLAGPAKKSVFSIDLDGKPFKAYAVAHNPTAESHPANASWKLGAPVSVEIDVPAGAHAVRIRLRAAGAPALGISLVAVPVTGTTIAAATPAATPASTPAPSRTPAQIAAPSATPAAPEPAAPTGGDRFSVTATGGYVASGGDLSNALAGLDFGWRPLPHSPGLPGTLRVVLGAERYSVSEKIAAEDPILSSYTRSYAMDVLPLYLGVGMRRGVGPVTAFGELSAGAFLVDGSWKATNGEGAIEPAKKVSGAPIGFRAGGGVLYPLGPGDVAAILRYREAALDNGETFDDVYPSSSDAYQILADVGGWSLSLGYSISF